MNPPKGDLEEVATVSDTGDLIKVPQEQVEDDKDQDVIETTCWWKKEIELEKALAQIRDLKQWLAETRKERDQVTHLRDEMLQGFKREHKELTDKISELQNNELFHRAHLEKTKKAAEAQAREDNLINSSQLKSALKEACRLAGISLEPAAQGGHPGVAPTAPLRPEGPAAPKPCRGPQKELSSNNLSEWREYLANNVSVDITVLAGIVGRLPSLVVTLNPFHCLHCGDQIDFAAARVPVRMSKGPGRGSHTVQSKVHGRGTNMGAAILECPSRNVRCALCAKYSLRADHARRMCPLTDIGKCLKLLDHPSARTTLRMSEEARAEEKARDVADEKARVDREEIGSKAEQTGLSDLDQAKKAKEEKAERKAARAVKRAKKVAEGLEPAAKKVKLEVKQEPRRRPRYHKAWNSPGWLIDTRAKKGSIDEWVKESEVDLAELY